MIQISRTYRLHYALLPGLLALVAGCATVQSPPTPTPTAAAVGPMAGCGMMVDGKMVYATNVPADCMTMNKPANMTPNGVTMMPNGVTMPSDPAHP
jgi:hypothetical protein